MTGGNNNYYVQILYNILDGADVVKGHFLINWWDDEDTDYLEKYLERVGVYGDGNKSSKCTCI